MRQRIYVDNSVLGGYYDKEFEKDTKLFFQRIENKDFNVHISEITNAELIPAPQRVKDVIKKIPIDCLILLQFTEESQELSRHYIKEKALGEASLNDAYHIAIATVNRLDVLVSWNFRHIVNLDKIRQF